MDARFRYIGKLEGNVMFYGGKKTRKGEVTCPPQFLEKARLNPDFEEILTEQPTGENDGRSTGS